MKKIRKTGKKLADYTANGQQALQTVLMQNKGLSGNR